MSRPSFQFYPDNWRNNAKLRRCGWEARGVWIEVMCLLHDSDEYGVLRWPLKEIAIALGAPIKILKELESKGVLKGSDRKFEAFTHTPKHARKLGDPVVLLEAGNGPCWYSSRMLVDEWRRSTKGASTRFGNADQAEENAGQGDAPSRRQGERQGERDGESPSRSPSARQSDGSPSSSSPSVNTSAPIGAGSTLPMPDRVGEAAEHLPSRFPDDEPPPHPLPDHPDEYRGSPGPDDDHDLGPPPAPLPPKKLAFDEGLLILAPNGGKKEVANGRAFLIGICRRLNDDDEFLRVVRDCARDQSLDPREFMSAAVEYRLGRRTDRNGNRAVGKLPPRGAYTSHTKFPDRDVPF